MNLTGKPQNYRVHQKQEKSEKVSSQEKHEES